MTDPVGASDPLTTACGPPSYTPFVTAEGEAAQREKERQMGEDVARKVTEATRQPYRIPGNERYFLDADGYCWREVEMNGEVWHSMARVNPDNSPTPRPLTYLTPVTEEHHTLRAYRLALLDAAAIFAEVAQQHAEDPEGSERCRWAYAEGSRVLRQWAADPGRMVGPLHRIRADDLPEAEVDNGQEASGTCGRCWSLWKRVRRARWENAEGFMWCGTCKRDLEREHAECAKDPIYDGGEPAHPADWHDDRVAAPPPVYVHRCTAVIHDRTRDCLLPRGHDGLHASLSTSRGWCFDETVANSEPGPTEDVRPMS